MFQSKRKQELQAALEKLEAAENRLSELEADWQAIQRSVALAVMSGDGLFESVSDVFLDMLGYQEQHLTGKHHRLLCKPEDARGEEYIRFSMVERVTLNPVFSFQCRVDFASARATPEPMAVHR